MVKLWSIVVVFCFLSKAVCAQNGDTLQVTGTVFMGLTYAQPTGNFQKAYAQAQAFGGNFGLLVKPNPGIRYLEVGAQISYLVNGIDLYTDNSNYYYNALKTTHSYIPIHGIIRFKPLEQGVIIPYLDGLAGISVFKTRSKVKQDITAFFSEAEEAFVLNKYGNTVLSYGLAAGFYFGSRRHKSFRGDIRLVYLEGPIASYVKKGNLTVDNGGYPNYNISTSESSMLFLQLNLAGLIYSHK